MCVCVCVWYALCVCYTYVHVCVCTQAEARSVDHLKNLNKGLENKIIQLQQKLTSEVRKAATYTTRQNCYEKH